jgi:hypothetical protein
MSPFSHGIINQFNCTHHDDDDDDGGDVMISANKKQLSKRVLQLPLTLMPLHFEGIDNVT